MSRFTGGPYYLRSKYALVSGRRQMRPTTTFGRHEETTWTAAKRTSEPSSPDGALFFVRTVALLIDSAIQLISFSSKGEVWDRSV